MQPVQVTGSGFTDLTPSAAPYSGSRSELRDRGEAHRTGLARRNVVVAVGSRPVALVEDVLHVELHAPHLVDLGVDRRIEADETGQTHAVVGRCKGVREIDHT